MATAIMLARGEGRMPPQDLEAETSVLGAILLDQVAITRVLDLLNPEDFYRENNGQIYRAALNLFREGEPIDNVTLAAELEKMSMLERVGGRAQLALLQESVPTAANVEHYARIVKDRAYKRRLITAGGQVTALGYDDSLEAEEAVNQAQAQVYAISDDRVGSGLERLYDLLRPAMDRIDAQMATGGGVIGVPSGFHDLDRMTNGFKPSDLVIIAGRPAMGKALSLDTPIPAPTGWSTMGSLRVGDQVFDERSRPCTVTYASPVQLGRTCYEVLFSDGARIVADADHQWLVWDRECQQRILTTQQMADTLRAAGDFMIPYAPPLLPMEGRVLAPAGGPLEPSGMGRAPASGPFAGVPREGFRLVEAIRPVPSVPVRCIQVDSPSHLYLASEHCVPTHNTSFVTNVALHAAVEHKKPVVIFSLEMSKEQLVERLLCEQARIDAQRMHRGTLSDAEYERLAGALGPLGDAPIFIDDSPTLDDLTLRLKSRQARSREGIEMVIVDYLQLMHGRTKGDDANRVQEVSQISRSLKAIARELYIPVIAISQLSRAPEARPDKRPILSDLRESGCMPASTRLLRADTGQEISLGELVLSQEQPMVWSVDNTWRLVPSRLVRTFPTGVRPTFQLRLASGREVDATANHRFRTVDGWRRLEELAIGQYVAVPRRLPAPTTVRDCWNRDELVLLAHLIGDGSVGLPGVRYATADEDNRRAVCDAARRRFGIEVKGERLGRTWQLWFPSPYRLTHGRYHPVRDWLERFGLWGCRAPDKFIPEEVHGLADELLVVFMHHLWSTDGSITLSRNGKGAVVRVYYASTSRRLAEGVQRVLLRLDIRTRLRMSRRDGYRPIWNVDVVGTENIQRFLAVVGCHGERGRIIPDCNKALATIKPNPDVDLIPHVVDDQVRAALKTAGVSHRELAARLGEWYCGSYLLGSDSRRRRFSRHRLEHIGCIAGDSGLMDLATSDMFWDEVVAISPRGDRPTFDATVEQTHNFIANGIVAHNSIEQDSDVVMFLYRDEYYNRDKSEKPGIAEVIVAKHRNGPTGVVELMFRRELTRFENLERRRPEGPQGQD